MKNEKMFSTRLKLEIYLKFTSEDFKRLTVLRSDKPHLYVHHFVIISTYTHSSSFSISFHIHFWDGSCWHNSHFSFLHQLFGADVLSHIRVLIAYHSWKMLLIGIQPAVTHLCSSNCYCDLVTSVQPSPRGDYIIFCAPCKCPFYFFIACTWLKKAYFPILTQAFHHNRNLLRGLVWCALKRK